MNLTVAREPLLRALDRARGAVERRNTILILANARLRADSGTLEITATDMDLEITAPAAAEIAQDGATTADVCRLCDIVKKLPTGVTVEMETVRSDLVLRARRSRFVLPTLPVEDFPVMAGGDMPCRFTLPAPDLRRLIDRTRFAISTDEMRYYLNGIFLHVLAASRFRDASVLRAVATNGHQLARVEIALPEGAGTAPDVIIPRKTVAELRRLLDDGDGPVAVELSDTKARFSLAGVTVLSKLIDGTFPEYERVIPQANDRRLEVDTRALAEAVARVAIISEQTSRPIRFTLDGGICTVSCRGGDLDTAEESVEANYRGEPMIIGFNAAYVGHVLGEIAEPRVRIDLGDAGSAAVIRGVDDPSALFVLMPLRAD